MKIRCDYCGNVYQPSSFRPTCVCCGAPAPINETPTHNERKQICTVSAEGTVWGLLAGGTVTPIDFRYGHFYYHGGYDK